MTEATGSSTGESQVSIVGGYSGKATGSSTGESIVSIQSTIIETPLAEMAVLTDEAADPPLELLTEMAVLTAGTQRADFLRDSQLAVQTLSQITAEEEYLYEMAILTDGSGMTDTQASQVAVLTMSRANPDRRKMRAWSFVEDGHWFYVLHLGNTTTLVFDTLTRKWSEWKTFNMNNWRANYGVNWNGDILAGGIDNNIIYQVGLAYSTDDQLPIVSIITGGYPMRMTNSITVDEVTVTSSVGMGSTVDATLRLRTSDNYGLSWTDWGALDLDTATPQTRVSWSSLGIIQAPGRIFELTDSGAARRINSLELFSRDVEE